MTGLSGAKREAYERVTQPPQPGAYEPATRHRSPANPEPVAAGLSIVIPAYNAIGTVEPLLDQLMALSEVQAGEYEVILTDDASTDGTAAYLQSRYPALTCIESAVNTGFGSNANRGIAAARKGYTALVNTDIELAGNPFPKLMQALHDHQHYFAMMPLVFNTARQQVENLQRLTESHSLAWNEDLPVHQEFSARIAANFEGGRPSAQLLPNLAGLRDLGSMQILNSILCGACFVCSTSKLRELQGFDSFYAPFYWEDVDLGQRALQTAYPASTGTLITALVLHRHSESINAAHGALKVRFLRLNQLRFSLRHLRPAEPPPKQTTPEAKQLLARLRAYKFDFWLRGVRECFGGDPVLRKAYFSVAGGAVQI